MTRTIQSPGFELHEIDRSQYNRKVDNSIPNAPVCLVLGYADKGEDYATQWINIKDTFVQSYGYPKNEEERYLYNTALQILNVGGICLASKLPYQNGQKQNYAYVDYAINDSANIFELSNTYQCLSDVYEIDHSLSNVLLISNTASNADNEDYSIFNQSGTITNVELNNYLNELSLPEEGTIKFVDISHTRYSTTYCNSIYNNTKKIWSNDCLGIVPVIVTPTNALYFQDLISSSNYSGQFNNISAFVPCKLNDELCVYTSTDAISSSLYQQFNSDDKDIETVSKQTIDLFPTIIWKTANSLDKKYLKNIGVVVLKAYTDTANNNSISFQILESFVGTLDKNEALQNPSVNYINDVVNQNSEYIRMFSNIDQTQIDKMNISYICQQKSTSLGFYDIQCEKTLNSSNEIIEDIKLALQKVSNRSTQQIDLVVDAGITNIVQKTYQSENNKDFVLNSIEDSKQWSKACNIFDDFCKNTRQDCMFIADGLKPLCLINDQKIVNPIVNKTVKSDIVPKFKFMQALNSSYSAGYCNWLMIQDDYSEKYFWIPPSSMVVRSYINCSTYFHTWDAPAGMIRGVLNNAIDVAFNPNQSEADYIYMNGWNYAISYPIEGIVIEGQKTFQSELTALDRVNVRRLMLWLERGVLSMAKYFVYEQNTSYNRQRFVDTLKPLFEQAKSGYGISDYAIKCDDEINTDETIERNELHMKIAVKPIKTIEFICISFVLTNQTANVDEEVLK